MQLVIVASGLVSSWRIKTPLSNIPLVGPFFWLNYIKQVNSRHEMNEIVNKLIPEMYLRHIYSPDLHIALVDHLQKQRRIKKITHTGDWRYIYLN